MSRSMPRAIESATATTSNGKTTVRVVCPWCGKASSFTIDEAAWENGLAAYWKGALMQDAFPSLSQDERELLITGICSECF